MGARSPWAHARGMSLVELMVGLAIGLFIVAGTLTMFANLVGSSRQLLQQARLHQEMRSVMDLVTRDLRRAGAWDNAIKGTIAIGAGSATTPNPYRFIETSVTAEGADVIEHRFTRDAANDDLENDTLDSYERFGFRRQGDVLHMRLGGAGWQPLTDSAVIKVKEFGIQADGPAPLPLPSACRGGCSGLNCPTLTVRQYTLTLVAELSNDSSVKRTMSTTVRPRNDQTEGACP